LLRGRQPSESKFLDHGTSSSFIVDPCLLLVWCVLEAGDHSPLAASRRRIIMSSSSVAKRKAAGIVVKAEESFGEAEWLLKERQAALEDAVQQAKAADVKHTKKIARNELQVTRSGESARDARDKVRSAHLLA